MDYTKFPRVDSCWDGQQWILDELLKEATALEKENKNLQARMNIENCTEPCKICEKQFNPGLIEGGRCVFCDLKRLKQELRESVKERDNLYAELISFQEHHAATEWIIADARGQSPENGSALLFNMDRLKQDKNTLEAEKQILQEALENLCDAIACATDKGYTNYSKYVRNSHLKAKEVLASMSED